MQQIGFTGISKEQLETVLKAIFSEELERRYEELLIESYHILKKMGKENQAKRIANKAAKCRVEDFDFEGYAYQYMWAGDAAREVDKEKTAHKLYKKAIDVFIADLKELDVGAFGEHDGSLLDQLLNHCDKLNLKHKKIQMLEAAIAAYKKGAAEANNEEEKEDYEYSAKEVADMLAEIKQ